MTIAADDRAYPAVSSSRIRHFYPGIPSDDDVMFPVTYYDQVLERGQVMVGSVSLLIPLSLRDYARLPRMSFFLGDDMIG